ncbi:uncharacterized vacuolar membrane protein YML018C-like [Magnolia sinica]|uniref:uncharacterized vacuolar membrane protein YML018C-like n=1 Tax=Magnolia sinica TaxID=86752 RepID=UPI002658BF95|nr:uncharacterized vacuolar membrane protein YML018C-like [Magnolia sinica]XP_058069388.1 uncharacterized vacuolar membrane protein YML018C-like [Magnolia sinica]XP_058069389.1 uncharacterized vacuolar membrane protein YML018C-like [Magnolia sinica]
MQSQGWRWTLGLVYIVAVAIIWIAASYIVQSVVNGGVSPFLITYICNSLFVIYIPIIEIARYWEDTVGSLWVWRSSERGSNGRRSGDSEEVILLSDCNTNKTTDGWNSSELVNPEQVSESQNDKASERDYELQETEKILPDQTNSLTQPTPTSKQLDAKGRWTRARVAKVSLLICPFWFLAQLTFNMSLKYTTVTSNTILSSSSSLFTFFVSVAFLDEKFTCVKLSSVLLCMAGTILVSVSDSETGTSTIVSNPILGDILSLVSAGLYSIYITLIRKKMPDGENGEGQASMAQFLGFVGLFNLLIFLPVALVLNFTRLEPFHELSLKQFGLIVGKGLLDNVLSDYLWAKAVLLTTPTATTAGLSIQVPLAALVDTLTGHAPSPMHYLGSAAAIVGFVGLNVPSNSCCGPKAAVQQREAEIVSMVNIPSDSCCSPKGAVQEREAEMVTIINIPSNSCCSPKAAVQQPEGEMGSMVSLPISADAATAIS